MVRTDSREQKLEAFVVPKGLQLQRREICWEGEKRRREEEEGGQEEERGVEGGGGEGMRGGRGGGGGDGMRETGGGRGGGGGGGEKREGGGGGGSMHEGEIEGERGGEEAMEGVREMGLHQDSALNSVNSSVRESEEHEDTGAAAQRPIPPTKLSSNVG